LVQTYTTLGWSDGTTFLPIDFSLLSSTKSQINGMSSNIDKHSSGYKRRIEALQTAPEQIPSMIQRAMIAGIDASYVLMDTWFTQQPLIKTIKEQGLDVIGMVKKLKQRYLVDGNTKPFIESHFLRRVIKAARQQLYTFTTISVIRRIVLNEYFRAFMTCEF
jgi:hypothetical protein